MFRASTYTIWNSNEKLSTFSNTELGQYFFDGHFLTGDKNVPKKGKKSINSLMKITGHHMNVTIPYCEKCATLELLITHNYVSMKSFHMYYLNPTS